MRVNVPRDRGRNDRDPRDRGLHGSRNRVIGRSDSVTDTVGMALLISCRD